MSLAYGAGLVFGVYTCFLGYGVAQEKIYKAGSAADGFTYFGFLVFVLCVSNALLALSILIANRGVAGLRKRIALLDRFAVKEIAITSFTYCLSMLATNYALTHVTYPTQVLIKSIKMVPVTVGGFVFFGKRYPWYDYAAVVLVSSSLIVFNLAKGAKAGGHQTASGLFFLFVSLACDSVTGPRQDRLISRYPSFDPVFLMFLTNVFAVLWSGVATATLEGSAAFSFCVRHPQAAKYIAAFAICGSVGQVFIFSTLTYLGSLYLTLITTTRKFFTVFLSVLLFGHHINPTQWGCVATIFGSLTFQGHFSKKDKDAKKRLAKLAPVETELVKQA